MDVTPSGVQASCLLLEKDLDAFRGGPSFFRSKRQVGCSFVHGRNHTCFWFTIIRINSRPRKTSVKQPGNETHGVVVASPAVSAFVSFSTAPAATLIFLLLLLVLNVFMNVL